MNDPTSVRAREADERKNKMGQIQLVLGPMFSGKSSELIRRLKRYRTARQKCLIVNSADDQRFDGFDTHSGSLMSIRDKLSYDVIGVNDGQRFPDLVKFCEEAAELGKIVIVSALDATSQRTGYPNVLALIPLAERVCKLTAVCGGCCGEASFTKKISVNLSDETDNYMPVCRDCFKLPIEDAAGPNKPLTPSSKVVDEKDKKPLDKTEREKKPPDLLKKTRRRLTEDHSSGEDFAPTTSNPRKKKASKLHSKKSDTKMDQF